MNQNGFSPVPSNAGAAPAYDSLKTTLDSTQRELTLLYERMAAFEAQLAETRTQTSNELASQGAILQRYGNQIQDLLSAKHSERRHGSVKEIPARPEEDSKWFARLVRLLPFVDPSVDFATFFTSDELRQVTRELVSADPLFLAAFLARGGSIKDLNLTQRRHLSQQLWARGYLRSSIDIMAEVQRVTDSDRDALALVRRRSELAVLSGGYTPSAPVVALDSAPGTVLHVVGKGLPATQTGYTLRTQYLVAAQRRAGLQASVACQLGRLEEGVDRNDGELVTELVDGVPYFYPVGPERNECPLGVWLDQNTQALANVVEKAKPQLLHAHSDFINALSAEAVGAASGIPVVYEVRGFWEESWLSRILDRFGITDRNELAQTYGLPDVFTLRTQREVEVRRNAAHVFTLGQVMRNRLERQGTPADAISIVPNCTDGVEFPVPQRDAELAQNLGLPEDAVIVGCITSLVEYEGIDLLIEAFATLRDTSSHKINLLIVGDGATAPKLKSLASDMGVAGDVHFTGKVPHSDIVSYYSLIDIFVVPRKPVEVCHLVTPLKPLEALATGRALVMSDVRALAEIASDSSAAVLFKAGDTVDLARVLSNLVDEPERRLKMGQDGANWVRRERSWERNNERYMQVYRKFGLAPAQQQSPAE